MIPAATSSSQAYGRRCSSIMGSFLNVMLQTALVNLRAGIEVPPTCHHCSGQRPSAGYRVTLHESFIKFLGLQFPHLMPHPRGRGDFHPYGRGLLSRTDITCRHAKSPQTGCSVESQSLLHFSVSLLSPFSHQPQKASLERTFDTWPDKTLIFR